MGGREGLREEGGREGLREEGREVGRGREGLREEGREERGGREGEGLSRALKQKHTCMQTLTGKVCRTCNAVIGDL